jgi:hypothetical protein
LTRLVTAFSGAARTVSLESADQAWDAVLHVARRLGASAPQRSSGGWRDLSPRRFLEPVDGLCTRLRLCRESTASMKNVADCQRGTHDVTCRPADTSRHRPTTMSPVTSRTIIPPCSIKSMVVRGPIPTAIVKSPTMVPSNAKPCTNGRSRGWTRVPESCSRVRRVERSR